MAELTLHPYSVVQRWTIPPEGAAPEILLKEYLELLAEKIQAAGDCVIGHIKALALFPDRQYLRVSVVAAHLPASIDGAAPPGCTSLEVTLNVLVYGLPAERAADLTRAAGEALMQKHALRIELAPSAQKGAAPHAHGGQ